ncbi:DUF4168 domain-containing protein [Spirulina subsalsa FACHB-351]|uniref:DUF4168 domain-containing protein n=1 Tax=Spirulina subsalsa FACHB-351 TaxID=234711 RepID=A0ABT3L2A4_9CYAN|nr:DUF4168 domain-containing protein [Spirulina subsalsa]MCW6035647.1 DUF4168 domain-containing protein [Spirulina subsalsa FACHB-351]
MLTLNFSSIGLQKALLRVALTSAIAGAGVVMGVAPNVTQPLTRWFDTTVYAQSVSSEEVTNYARAAIAVERLRQNTYSEIKRLVNPVPNIACNQRAAFSGLPGNARQIAESYCNQSTVIVERHGLTIQRFNEITSQRQSDNSLEQRIQQAIRNLQ